jgi:hypothetical protein
MPNDRTGWAAAVGTLYKMRDGRTVKITEYRVYYFEPGSSGAANHAAGINEFINGVLVKAKETPARCKHSNGIRTAPVASI